MVGENPTPYGILELWAVNGLSIVYWVPVIRGQGRRILISKRTILPIFYEYQIHRCYFSYMSWMEQPMIQSTH